MIKKDGFSFSFDESKCQHCGGKCCIGDSGYVFLNENEMREIANFLQLEFENFTKKFVRQIGNCFSLIEKEHISGRACIFFDDESQCTIYQVRPKHCRDFPFWDIFKNNPKGAFRECIGVIKDES